MRNTPSKPFLKWAGGKTQLLEELEKRIPEELKDGKLPVFIEPFVGGGAVFFHFNNIFNFDKCHIFDINEEIILAYTVVRDDVDSLISQLDDLSSEFLSSNDIARKEFYYQVRDEFNHSKADVNFSRFGALWTERAAQLIFLNRTCFNGLFRVNTQGEFNVPFGRYKKPKILNADLLRADSDTLQNTEIHHGDFISAGSFVSERTFVYFDPPYRPLNQTSSFTGYSKNGFCDSEQRRLARFFADCNAAGAKLMLSNSDPKNIDYDDDFFDTLYSDYKIERVPAKRMINCDATKRGEISEIIVTNF
jgi:DNA adenine methylase